jgi:hypothetical protein
MSIYISAEIALSISILWNNGQISKIPSSGMNKNESRQVGADLPNAKKKGNTN